MIKFRLKQKTYSRVEDSVLRDPSINKIVNKLDSNRISNYGLSTYIPNDSISVNYGIGRKCVVNLPLDMNQFQYDIEDYFMDSSPRIRYSLLDSRNLMRYFIRIPMNENDVYDLLIHIINKVGYVVLCPESKI